MFILAKSLIGECDGEELVEAFEDVLCSPNPPRRSTGPRLEVLEVPPVVCGLSTPDGGMGMPLIPAERSGMGESSASGPAPEPGRLLAVPI
jgi:hypothetical protein